MSIPVNYNDYEIEQMRKTMSTKQIAEFYKVSVNALKKWCSRNGVSLLRMTDEDLEEEIYFKTPKEIALENNITAEAVYKRLKKLGINPKIQMQYLRTAKWR